MANVQLKYYRFLSLLQLQGWMSPCYAGVDRNGDLQYLSEQPPNESAAIEFVDGYAIPGFPNAHSHAFQYAMAGVAEKHLPGITDDFWKWRKAMYDCALSMEPDHVEAVAAMVYAEMLRFGYTHVAEFHYLHHDVNGRPYSNVAELGERIIAGAATAGINLTLVPIFYQLGGFGKDHEPPQRRFISKTIDEYFSLLDATTRIVAAHKGVLGLVLELTHFELLVRLTFLKHWRRAPNTFRSTCMRPNNLTKLRIVSLSLTKGRLNG